MEQYPCARRGIELFLGTNDAATRLYEDITMSLLQKWVEESLGKESQKPESTRPLTIRLMVNDHPVLKPRNYSIEGLSGAHPYTDDVILEMSRRLKEFAGLEPYQVRVEQKGELWIAREFSEYRADVSIAPSGGDNRYEIITVNGLRLVAFANETIEDFGTLSPREQELGYIKYLARLYVHIYLNEHAQHPGCELHFMKDDDVDSIRDWLSGDRRFCMKYMQRSGQTIKKEPEMAYEDRRQTLPSIMMELARLAGFSSDFREGEKKALHVIHNGVQYKVEVYIPEDKQILRNPQQEAR